MGKDQEIDTAGTEADDESVAAKRQGFGEHARPPREGDQPKQSAKGKNKQATIPDEPASDGNPPEGAGVTNTGDKGGVS
jgi:hypothetical protein